MKQNENKILALKYRPKNFNELIGQNIMVQTITNSIKLDKLPNAYLLTGIRGVGKTTTARLIAKAINCKKDFVKGESCGVGEKCHCVEIGESRHLDVLEMDAASRTGIDDVRELIETSKYNPTSSKYKVFIIDEVHMLSKQAFNGLLKTLEEPPPHLKFIFATTEVKKIPVTIISRCQRFDLNRVSINILLENLRKIIKIEKGKISEPALKLIAKASEGSVRDSLSLLDRALIGEHINHGEVDEQFVRKMLGISDRSKILELFNFVLQGNEKKSVDLLRKMINDGLEPINLLNDFLEIIYFAIQKKNLGSIDSDVSLSEAEQQNINLISKSTETSTLILFWQFMLKGLDELNIVANPILSIEMLIIRLLYLKDMPSYEKTLDLINRESNTNNSNEISIKSNIENEKNKISKDQIKNTTQTKPELTAIDLKKNISSFEDLINLASEKREVELKYDLERNVNLIKFSHGKIDISFNDNLRKSFVRNLSEKLHEWTGKRWVITLTKKAGQKTFLETKLEKKEKMLKLEKNSLTYKKFKNIFSDGELIDVVKKD